MNRSVPVFYEHGTLDWNLDFSGTAGCSTGAAPTCPPDDDPDNSMAGVGTALEDRDDVSTVQWLLDRHDLRTRAKRQLVPDEDPATSDSVDTTARLLKKRLAGGSPARDEVLWLEMVGGLHAVSALNHEGDVCDDLVNPPGQTDCNTNPNASKDFETSFVTIDFMERFAGMLA